MSVAFGGANAKHEFILFTQPRPEIRTAQDVFSQYYETFCHNM
jgi:hypothetical protein